MEFEKKSRARQESKLSSPRNPKAKGIFLGVRKSEYPNTADYNDKNLKY